MIPLGQLVKPHGIKGELKVLFFNENSKSLKSNQSIFLKDLNNKVFDYKIENIFYHSKKNRIKFFDIDRLEDAEKLRGWFLCVLRSDLPVLSDGEYYLNDLINYTLIDSSNKSYGIVDDVLALPANNVLSVMFKDKEYLIPLIDDVVLEINQEDKVITIDPISGLYD